MAAPHLICRVPEYIAVSPLRRYSVMQVIDKYATPDGGQDRIVVQSPCWYIAHQHLGAALSGHNEDRWARPSPGKSHTQISWFPWHAANVKSRGREPEGTIGLRPSEIDLKLPVCEHRVPRCSPQQPASDRQQRKYVMGFIRHDLSRFQSYAGTRGQRG